MSKPAAPGVPEETLAGGAVPIVLIGFGGASRRALCGILAPPQWETREAPTCATAAAMLHDRRVGVAICDSEVAEGNWRAVLAGLQGRGDPPNLIVSSRLADERLWAEVLHLGGYDVLMQPFDPSEVLRVARMAWMAWYRRCGRFPAATPANPNPDPTNLGLRAAS